MTRVEYYKELEKALKYFIRLPGAIYYEFPNGGRIVPLNLNLEDAHDTFLYEYHYNIGSWNGVIQDIAFDKFYNPYAEEYWGGRDKIQYDQDDVNRSVHNIKSIILNEFSKTFFK